VLYFAELDEIGQKLVLGVSWDRVNELLTPLVCLVTATERERSLPTFVPLNRRRAVCGDRARSFVITWSRSEAWRFADEPIGTVSAATLARVSQALQRVFDLGPDEPAEDAPAATELPPETQEPSPPATPPRDANP